MEDFYSKKKNLTIVTSNARINFIDKIMKMKKNDIYVLYSILKIIKTKNIIRNIKVYYLNEHMIQFIQIFCLINQDL